MTAAPEFPTELVLAYDKPGPRYTSYPTAPQFTESFGPEDYEREIARTNEAEPPSPLSLYVHLPFCRALCWFCACNVVITHRRERIGEYLELLDREIEMFAKRVRPGRTVVQVHWGGGTPSYLQPDEIEILMGRLRERFAFAADAEVSIEIDPREVTPAHFESIARAGFNRVSMGVQDFDPAVQEAIHRIQPLEKTRAAIHGSRAVGIESVNVDLVYGLPRQRAASFEKTLETTVRLAPDRIALFNYAHVPWLKKHQALIRPEELPEPRAKIDLLARAVRALTEAGYVFIGMDHFARPDDELAVAQASGTLYRNFQGYSTRAGADLLGLGATSIGSVGRAYAQNVKEIPLYGECIRSGRLPVFRGLVLSDDDLLRRHVITRLMCDFALDFGDVGRRFGIDFRGYFADALAALERPAADGLIAWTGQGLRVTFAGRLLIRNLCMPFDRYLAAERGPARYSRTV